MARKAGVISEETRADLIRVAAEEFSTKGFERSSLRQICSRAGVTTGALYFFFKNKDELFEEILSMVTRPLLEFMKEQNDALPDISMADITDGFDKDMRSIKTVLHLYYANEDIAGVLFNNRTHPAAAEFFDEVTEMSARHYTIFIEEIEKARPSMEPVDRFALRWFARQEIDAVLSLISQGFTEEEAVAHAAPIVRILRSGFISLIK